MPSLPLRKKLQIVKLYLSGFSYAEIALKTGVSKGSVGNVILELRAGHFPEAEGLVDLVPMLRDLSIDLRKVGIGPGEAMVGIGVLSRLQELRIDLRDIQEWADLCRELSPEREGAGDYIAAALSLRDVCADTGLGFEELVEKALDLKAEIQRLEGRVKALKAEVADVEAPAREVQELTRKGAELQRLVSSLLERRDSLRKDVGQRQRREAELAKRIEQKEEQDQLVSERLAVARQASRDLAVMGLPVEEIPGLAQRIGAIAQRHNIAPADLRQRLLEELEKLDRGLGLETVARKAEKELAQKEEALAEVERERAATQASVERLRKELAALRTAIKEEGMHLRREMRAIGKALSGDGEHLRREMGAIGKVLNEDGERLKRVLADGMAQALSEVGKLQSETLAVGREMGALENQVNDNRWVHDLMSLMGRRDGVSAADQVRAVGLTVLRPISAWLHTNPEVSLPTLLSVYLKGVIQQFEEWRT